MNKLSQRLRAMFGTEDESKKPKEKTYKSRDINIVENTKDGSIYVCILELLGKAETWVGLLRANNVEDGAKIVDYRLQGLPGGRTCFGGYTDEKDKYEKMLYSFSDVWYKIHGEPLSPNREFTKSELLGMVQEIREKLKEAKYMYLYSIKYKDSFPEKSFQGTKYFGAYTGEEDRKIFEAIDNDLGIQAFGDANDARLIITMGGKKIDAKSNLMYDRVLSDEGSPFEIEQIETIGVSRVFNKAKYTPDACRQIIRNYERKQDQGRE